MPSSGPAGTVITVQSVTACVVAPGGAPGHSVLVGLFDARRASVAPVTVVVVDLRVRAGGAWSGSVKVRASAKPGNYILGAACFAKAGDEEPVRVYDEQSFVVKATPTSPVAGPIAGSPSFTG
jgi:hypothetical protein